MRCLATILICLFLCSCVPTRVQRDAQRASHEQRWDEAHQLWTEVLAKHPSDVTAKLESERARLQGALDHLQKASYYLERGQLDEADFELGVVLALDPYQQQAQALVEKLKEKRAEREPVPEPLSAQEAYTAQLPTLEPTSWEPLDLYFPRPTSIKEMYSAIGQAYGINIVTDPKIRDEKMTIDLRNLPFLKVLDTLMVLNRHFFKIVDHNTLIILEDNKTNRDNYDNQIIQTFYLSNIEPKDLKAHLRQLGLKEFAENEKLNAITIKGTPDQISLAEKVISANDKSQPEVVIEIELLEVSKNNMRRFGILPVSPTDGSTQYRAGIIADPLTSTGSNDSPNGLRGIFPRLKSEDFLTLVPAVAIDFLKQTGDSKQVANPHLRVTSGEKATVRIGQSIPIANTSFTNANLSGSAGGNNNFGENALTTFSYNDIGININLTPRVHFNNEITLVVELEISSVVSGGLQPILGKRHVNTTIRLRNGETNVLAGLLSNDERKSLSGIPGLSDIPLIGKLFSNDEKVVNQTDIVMSIRPVIVRGPTISAADRAPYELNDLRLSSIYNRQAQAPTTMPVAPAREIHLEDDAPNQPETEAQKNQTPLRTSPQVREANTYIPSNYAPTKPSTFDKSLPIESPKNPPPNTAEPTDPAEKVSETPLPAMLSFTPVTIDGRVDQMISSQLFLTNADALIKGEIKIAFNKNLVHVEAVEPGYLPGPNHSRILMTPAWSNDRGLLTLVLSSGNEVGFSGSGILATIKFRAVSSGSGDLLFDNIHFEDLKGNLLPVEGLTAGVEVNP